MPKIFISYRRDDSEAITGRIYDRLVSVFGEGNVFQDVDDIPPGVDFRKYLQDQIAVCDVVLVVIGQRWVSIKDKQGRRRLHVAADFVRIEVEFALQQGKLVVPVLVDNAAMPDPSALPDTLHDLCYRNASPVRHNPDFNHDMRRLIEGIQRVAGSMLPSPAAPAPEPPPLDELAAQVRAIIGAPFEWCAVPAGPFWMGSDRRKDKRAFADEPELHQVTLPGFAIAKYPITYAQFQTFVAAKDGFHDPRWWEGLAADAAHKKRPGDQAWKIATHPRENVSWYAAIAFCRWLSWRVLEARGVNPLSAMDLLKPATWPVRLPTEAEWEKAARGTDGRIWPWGNDFDVSKCNTEEAGIGRTTPVDGYPAGASPYGVWDMSGNVWEWCLSEWTDPYQHKLVGEIDITSNNSRVLRGGSWASNYTRAACRGGNVPTLVDFSIGFRCALSL